MKKFITTSAIILAGISCTNAQDVHFSQQGFSPLTLNPALCGANSPLQVNANYRSQWKSVSSPYTTIAASIDARFNDGDRTKKGIIAGGLNFYNDQSGDIKISTTSINVNLAYHLILDRENNLGVGIYGGYGQKGITLGNEQWGNQYNGMAYDASMPSNETFNYPTFNYLDAGAGLVYTHYLSRGYMTQNFSRLINAGIAFHHVNTPSNSFQDTGNDKIYLRWNIFFNGLFGIQNTRGYLMPGFYFNRQKSAMEIVYGTYYRYMVQEGSKVTGFNKPFFFSIGAFHRVGDALIAKVLMEYFEYSFGFAYDFNFSELTRSSRTFGSFELMLRYNMEPGGFSRAKM